jgi:hypothetical protein
MKEIVLFQNQSVISSVKNLIDCITEKGSNKMCLEDLVSILFRIDEDMLVGYMEYDDWTIVCDEVVFLAGWTNDQLIDAIDKRWGSLKDVKPSPQMKGNSS